jgi:pimeloyl-ACP methyl ester carboxylesterase
MKVISKDGTAIAYDKTGQGPALVLVDGAFCYRAYGVSPKLVPLLSSHFTVFSYDRRGRGESADTKPYTVEREIDDLKTIVDLTGEQPFVFGSSSGAALAMQAVGHGLSVKKIALFEPPYVVTSDRDTGPPNDAQLTLVNFIERGDRTGAVKYFMKDVMGMPAPIVFLFKLFGRSYWLICHTQGAHFHDQSTGNSDRRR